MRYLMFTGNDDRTEVHRYSDDEVTEIFGKARLHLMPWAFSTRGAASWVDMEHAAKKRNWEDFTN
jgi:hypothetical protein